MFFYWQRLTEVSPFACFPPELIATHTALIATHTALIATHTALATVRASDHSQCGYHQRIEKKQSGAKIRTRRYFRATTQNSHARAEQSGRPGSAALHTEPETPPSATGHPMCRRRTIRTSRTRGFFPLRLSPKIRSAKQIRPWQCTAVSV